MVQLVGCCVSLPQREKYELMTETDNNEVEICSVAGGFCFQSPNSFCLVNNIAFSTFFFLKRFQNQTKSQILLSGVYLSCHWSKTIYISFLSIV